MERGIEKFIQTGKQSLRRFDGATTEFTRCGGLFFVQCQVAVPMLPALVDDEPAGEAPDLFLVDEEMERELTGRKEVPPTVAIESPAPGEPVKSGDITDTHTSPTNLGASSASELLGEKTVMSHDHKCSQARQSSNAISDS